MTRDEASQAIDRAADLICDHGWAQGRYGNESDGFCAVGALIAATPRSSAVYALALERVATQIGENRPIIHWNDEPERTRDEVVRTLRQAAKRGDA